MSTRKLNILGPKLKQHIVHHRLQRKRHGKLKELLSQNDFMKMHRRVFNRVIKTRWVLQGDGECVLVRFVMKRFSMWKDGRDESPRRNTHPLQSHSSVTQFCFHTGSNTSCAGQIANSCRTKSASNLGPRIQEQIVEFVVVVTPQRVQRRTVELSIGVPVSRLPSGDPSIPLVRFSAIVVDRPCVDF